MPCRHKKERNRRRINKTKQKNKKSRQNNVEQKKKEQKNKDAQKFFVRSAFLFNAFIHTHTHTHTTKFQVAQEVWYFSVCARFQFRQFGRWVWSTFVLWWLEPTMLYFALPISIFSCLRPQEMHLTLTKPSSNFHYCNSLYLLSISGVWQLGVMQYFGSATLLFVSTFNFGSLVVWQFGMQYFWYFGAWSLFCSGYCLQLLSFLHPIQSNPIQ